MARISVFLLLLCYLFPSATTASEGEEEFVEERRLRLWSNQLKNPDLVRSTYLRVNHMEGTDPGSWVYEWSAIADYFVVKGETLEAEGERVAARDAYLAAAKLYGVARFPANSLPGQAEAYRKHLGTYQRAGTLFDPPLQVIEIPYDNAHITGYLHLPPEGERPPLILWNGGIDTWKGDSYNNIQPYLEAGFAVLTFDVLGTGENTRWPARPDATDLHATVLEFMQKSPLVDGGSIAHVGFSFSGNLAARLSMTEPRLFAVIAACAGVHDAWNDRYSGKPWEIREALGTALHIDPADGEKITEVARGFSLVRQGLLEGPDSVKVPLLVVNGDRDNLVPVSDLHLLAEAGRETDLWIMGGDSHCFGGYRSIVMPKMAMWLNEKLAAHRAGER